MPKGTDVDKCFQNVKRKKGSTAAAKICQAKTGKSLKTGRKPKKQ